MAGLFKLVNGQLRRICTEYVNPPAPLRSFDWAAWVDGREESGPIGWGATEQRAVEDLMEQLEKDD
jgi:hypothetical protein